MNARDIEKEKVYVGKSGLLRRVNRFRIIGACGADPVGDIYYTPIDRQGKEGKEKGTSSELFAAWAVSEVPG
ncbi:hypothetical protein [Paenibacillus cymbidii]|uniref:hypothetical protein n=1 Tax=Paenibacillus cymbidii TaxID=1639034 RepID=UPI001081F72F|nr:hypothetical protein [Paenibacillus cymbidii]